MILCELSMPERNPLILKLENGAALTDADRQQLQDATTVSREVAARQDIIREGDAPNAVHLVMNGFACRYKTLPNGRRSIMAYLVPGDFCDLHVSILGEMDHTIATLTPCTMVEIPHVKIQELTRNPNIARAFWWATLVDEGILREWLVNMGQRAADQQMAHLLCELLFRLQTVGRATENSFLFPITQDELADTLGISAVHINRVLQQLREDGLIVLRERRVTFADVSRIMEFCGFTPNYLHLQLSGGRRGSTLDKLV
jgi:CRP-like cAMP-binding protein